MNKNGDTPPATPARSREDRSPQNRPSDGAVPPADRLLLAGVRAGDADVGQRFVRDHYPGVYRYLLHLTGSLNAAEDLTQVSFHPAWRRLDTFEGRAAL